MSKLTKSSFEIMTDNMTSASIINFMGMSNNIIIYKTERSRC